MSIQKTEWKIALLHQRGVETENAKEAAEREVQQALGGLRVLQVSQKNMQLLIPAAKNALEEADCDLKQVEVGVRQVERCVESLTSLINTLRVSHHKLMGRAELLADQVKVLDKELKAEQAKLEDQLNPPEQEEGGAPGRRTPGVHPGESLKAQRQREEKLSQTDIGPTEKVEAEAEKPEAEAEKPEAKEVPNGSKPRKRKVRKVDAQNP